MAQITAALVKSLRDTTGAGMMDAKKALVESDGDTEAAIEWLRAKGLSKAAKKSGRTAADGLVAAVLSDDGKTGALVELNAETDFVARNEQFQNALREIAGVALTTDGTLEGLQGAPSPDGDGTVEDMVKRMVATIGENMSLRRTQKLSVESGAVGSYIHNAAAAGLGQIGVLVAISGNDAALAAEHSKKFAMHVAASAPLAMTETDFDPALLEREKKVLVATAKEAGKSDAGIESWSTKQLAKFVKANALMEQKFIMDTSSTISKAVKAIGEGYELTEFARFELGEGIEKEEDDFAGEVAAMQAAKDQ